ncbi:hypothetical protein [Sporisorium scitamineum]|uniref:Methyltransferase domain-containing protein n=1 Tax=Sporisorium scitamineum TaxID=49012 RepID=A0A0F7RWM8_9BASI|nr:hypothetical protein [Sporisorium scitamineum]
MLEITARGIVGGGARSSCLSFAWEASSKPLPRARQSRNLSASSTAPSTPSSRAYKFWTSDDPLIKALRRRQESYRLGQVPQGARHRADRLEAVQLAKSEIRWIVEHVRKIQTPTTKTKSTLNRASRRQLVSMAMQMTRHNVPISYLLGSVPFGSLSQELTVRPPILLPRPETEHWANEVVKTLTETLYTSQLEKVRVIDLCTGSGCIALLIADALRAKLGTGGRWKVVALDQSALAVELAKENALKLGFGEDQSNVHIVKADVFDDAAMDQLAGIAGGPFHLIVSNPPYIPRREWDALPAEVKQHEDPAALIGERDIASTSSTSPSLNQEATDARQAYLDRQGLAFHQRLAELLYRPTFSTRLPALPRLVAEYGKGQQRQVERLHVEMKAPRDRLPKVVRLEEHLVVVGLGNATTHPLTRHSIGQVVLDPLLKGLVEQDSKARARLREMRDELEKTRREAIDSGRVKHRPDWDQAVPTSLPVQTLQRGAHSDTSDLLDLTSTLSSIPSQLTKVTKGKSGGWSATIPLLISSSPTFFTPSRSTPDDFIYQIQLSLFKPSHPMNLSGVGLKSFLHSHHPHSTSPRSGRIEDDVLVLQDELDLAFGDVKRKDAGSARGHNGIKDRYWSTGHSTGSIYDEQLATRIAN